MHNKLFNVVFLFCLNPFIGSGFINLNTDLNLFYLLSVVLFLVYRVNILVILIIPFALILPVKYLFYVLLLIFVYKIKSYTVSNKILKFTVIIWFSILILEILFPEIRSILFFRDQTLYVGRGYSSFGPEPTTTGLFALSFFLCFKDKLSWLYKIIVSIIILATFNFIIIVIFILLMIKNYFRFNFETILITSLTTLILLGLTANLNMPSRMIEFMTVFASLNLDDIINFILNDSSLSTRLIPFLEYNTTDNSLISSGLFVPFNFYGFIYLIPTIYIISKVNSINKMIVLLLFFVSGSAAHLMPLYFFFKTNKYDISTNSSLQRQKDL